jgi:hypothetical protein
MAPVSEHDHERLARALANLLLARWRRHEQEEARRGPDGGGPSAPRSVVVTSQPRPTTGHATGQGGQQASSATSVDPNHVVRHDADLSVGYRLPWVGEDIEEVDR